jgi:hypothetical protein
MENGVWTLIWKVERKKKLIWNFAEGLSCAIIFFIKRLGCLF